MIKKINQKFPKNTLLLTLLIIGLTLLGFYCYKTKNYKQEPPSVEQSQGTIREDFPDFPIYPGSKIVSSQKTEGKNGQPASYQLYLDSTDTVAKIIEWYANELENTGWNIERPPDNSVPEDQNIVITKSQIMASVNVENESTETSISIHIQ